MKLLKLLILGLISSTTFANDEYNTFVESNTQSIVKQIQKKASSQKVAKLPLGKITEWTALQLVGKPYSIALLDQSEPEYMLVTLGATDCMIFVEEVLASSELIKLNQFNLNNLIKITKDLRYHGNVLYCNRNHYFKDWALENIEKGYVTDEAMKLTGDSFPFKAEVMGIKIAKNNDDPHKSDLNCILAREQVINQNQLGFIDIKKLPDYLKYIHSGDIIGIVRSPNGKADAVHHLGIAYVHNNVVSMIHASSKSGEVVIADTLLGYLGQFKDSQGILLLRPQLINSD